MKVICTYTGKNVLNREEEYELTVGMIGDAFNEVSCFGLKLVHSSAVSNKPQILTFLTSLSGYSLVVNQKGIEK